MDINNFGPFNADTWGTVSDWFVALVTLVTAYYLYKTLKSQLKVQELGQQALEFERVRFTRETRPDFELTGIDSKIVRTNDSDELEVIVTIKNIASHSAYNVRIIVDNDLDKWVLDESWKDQHEVVSGAVLYAGFKGPSFSDKKPVYAIDVNIFDPLIRIIINYQDVFKNNYSQRAFVRLTQKDKKILTIVESNAPTLLPS